MALGGGTFTSQNKVLPGSYINIVSASGAAATIGERGTAAFLFGAAWGETGLIRLTYGEFIRGASEMFGVDAADSSLAPIRDIFRHARTLYLYRVNNGEKAACIYATARYNGTLGNKLKIVITGGADDEFTVETLYGDTVVHTQTAGEASELVDNDYVTFDKTATLAATSGTALTGGSSTGATGADHTAFLAAIEGAGVNAVGTDSTDSGVIGTYVNWARSMRDEFGIKLQVVVSSDTNTYDSEAVICVQNGAVAVPWVIGVIAGTEVNKSATHLLYDGEAEVTAEYTQRQLEDAVKTGWFTLHKVGDDLRVLMDVNTLRSVSESKNAVFKDNKTVRVADRIATDMAALFNGRYLGAVINDGVGRDLLRSDICDILGELVNIGALESFDEDGTAVEEGADKNSVAVNVSAVIAGTMVKLYMTCVIA